MKKVDSHIRGTGNEGCDWHTTYMTSALVVQLCKEMQGTKRKFSLDHAKRPYPYCGPQLHSLFKSLFLSFYHLGYTVPHIGTLRNIEVPFCCSFIVVRTVFISISKLFQYFQMFQTYFQTLLQGPLHFSWQVTKFYWFYLYSLRTKRCKVLLLLYKNELYLLHNLNTLFKKQLMVSIWL